MLADTPNLLFIFIFPGLHPLCACCTTKPQHAATPSHVSPSTTATSAATPVSHHVSSLSQLNAALSDSSAIASPAAISGTTSRSSSNGSDDVTTTSSVSDLRRKAREHSQAVMLQSAAMLKPSPTSPEST